MTCKTIHFDSLQDTADNAASMIAHHLQALVSNTGNAFSETPEKVRLMVSGGSSPISLFQSLSQFDIDWHRVMISLVDERWVPENHPDSNTTLVRKYLLQHKASGALFQPIYQPASSLKEAVELLNSSFTPSAAIPTITILGMGSDAHTASLFPDAKEYQEGLTTAEAWLNVRPTAAPHARISMSLSHLSSSEHLYLFIPGSTKNKLFQEIQHGSLPDSPISKLLLQMKPDITVFCCPDATSQP